MDPNNQNLQNQNQPSPAPLASQSPAPKHISGPQKIIIIMLALLLVVALIGVAFTLGHNKKDSESSKALINVFASDQAKSRDIERETDIKAMHGQVEAYWAQNGYYPTFANMNDDTFLQKDLLGLDRGALKDPQGSDYKLVSSPKSGAYSYEVVPAKCDNVKTMCTSYTLTATLENSINGSTTFVKKSLNE